MHWNIYTTDAQNLLHVLALLRCYHQGIFTAVKVVLLKSSHTCTGIKIQVKHK